MQFENISNIVSCGLVYVRLDTGVPVLLRVLAALIKNRALVKDEMDKGESKGHIHGKYQGLRNPEKLGQVKGYRVAMGSKQRRRARCQKSIQQRITRTTLYVAGLS